MINFLIEPDSPNGDNVVSRFIYSAQELGYKTLLIEHSDLDSVPLPPENHPLVFFGSLNMIRKLQALQLPHKPVVWCDWEALSCHNYYAHYGKYMLQKEYGFYPYKELTRLKDFLYRTYGKDDKIFIRPSTNDKVFNGEVVEDFRFDRWHELSKVYEPKPELLCVVSKPSIIHSEYRLVIANGKVVTGSQYKIGGMVQSLEGMCLPSLIAYAEEVASVWQPHPIFVMDVATTRDDKAHVVEIGPINGAGLYKCDIRAVVQAMAEIAEL